MGRMKMYHPTVPQTVSEPVDVDERSFELCWSKPQLPHRPEPWRRWTSEQAAAEGREDDPEPATLVAPPRTGTGSGRDRWLEYAAEVGANIDGDEGKHEIIIKVEAHLAEEE